MALFVRQLPSPFTELSNLFIRCVTFLLYNPDPLDDGWIPALDVPSANADVDSASFVEDVEVNQFVVEPPRPWLAHGEIIPNGSCCSELRASSHSGLQREVGRRVKYICFEFTI